MVQSNAQTVAQYINELEPDRRKVISSIRKVILENLPEGYEESMQFGMIGYSIPLESYPKTYNGKPLSFAGLASQKNHMALYLMNVYGDKKTKQWFINEFKASGKKLDMGKSCVRFKKIEDLPLDVIGKAIARTSVEDYIKFYEAARK